MSTVVREFSAGDAVVSLIVWDASNATVADLESKSPGRGDARRVMTELLTFADNAGLSLLLAAEPFGDADLDAESLMAFYATMGFVAVGKGRMVREAP